MNTILYEVKNTVGLPAGHLGDGMPNALYEGSLIKGHRIAEFLDRLTEHGAVAPHIDQSAAESILDSPTGGAVVVPAQSASPAVENGLASKTRAELATMAQDLGLTFAGNATKAAIIALIEAHQASEQATPAQPANVVDDLDLSDVAGVSNTQ
jgi:hypothetical protein